MKVRDVRRQSRIRGRKTLRLCAPIGVLSDLATVPYGYATRSSGQERLQLNAVPALSMRRPDIWYSLSGPGCNVWPALVERTTYP
jgi:hypothetical protein